MHAVRFALFVPLLGWFFISPFCFWLPQLPGPAAFTLVVVNKHIINKGALGSCCFALLSSLVLAFTVYSINSKAIGLKVLQPVALSTAPLVIVHCLGCIAVLGEDYCCSLADTAYFAYLLVSHLQALAYTALIINQLVLAVLCIHYTLYVHHGVAASR